MPFVLSGTKRSGKASAPGTAAILARHQVPVLTRTNKFAVGGGKNSRRQMTLEIRRDRGVKLVILKFVITLKDS